MSTIKKRSWRNRDGSTGTAFVLGYQDRTGEWIRRQYPSRAEARAEQVRVDAELAAGAHVADRDSRTVADAVAAWLDDYEGLVDGGKRERSTLQRYRELARVVTGHDIAGARLSRLVAPDVARFGDWLERTHTHSQAKRTLDLLRSVLGHGVRVGWCAVNAAAEVRLREAGARHREPVVIPTKDELRRLFAAAEAQGPMAHALVSVLTLCGLRASELRGLRRQDVHADHLAIEQRADKWQDIGAPKSRTSRRTVPLPPRARVVLATWMLQAPHGALAFGSAAGTPLSYSNIWNRVWCPLMTAAELVDGDGRPLWGLHTLRHVAVSLWIEQGVQPKQVSAWAGHASVAFTLDVYGHLWNDPGAAASVAAAAERSLLG